MFFKICEKAFEGIRLKSLRRRGRRVPDERIEGRSPEAVCSWRASSTPRPGAESRVLPRSVTPSDSDDAHPRDGEEVLVLGVDRQSMGHGGGRHPRVHDLRPPPLPSRFGDELSEDAGDVVTAGLLFVLGLLLVEPGRWLRAREGTLRSFGPGLVSAYFVIGVYGVWSSSARASSCSPRWAFSRAATCGTVTL